MIFMPPSEDDDDDDDDDNSVQKTSYKCMYT